VCVPLVTPCRRAPHPDRLSVSAPGPAALSCPGG
jgi:hypothetical protein